jgi:hypothetical protein
MYLRILALFVGCIQPFIRRVLEALSPVGNGPEHEADHFYFRD